ncbi:MAG TPA: DNA sulfur modification protein DndB [Frankiaceae bacterium]|jgi:DNA sulfur modification protein DndB|nr:DNA sulfur modification protein DndB [Frankiaceae bacterium]
MASVIPCIQGRMGSTTYYETTMPARELVVAARPASDLDGWATQSVEERLQRELNDKRVREEIVPYLARSADRFFGSVIVLIYKGSVTFEPLEQVSGKVPAAYRAIAKRMGFLTIDGGQLIVLDGQHRHRGLQEVIQARNIDGEFVGDVPTDDVCVIFIEHESDQKTRRIFNKVNRYAKPTTRGDNIITSEDDGYAILTRYLLEDGAPLGVRGLNGETALVNWKSNTLAARSTQLTTVSAVYETVKDILTIEGMEPESFDEKRRVNRPTDAELAAAYEIVERWWKLVLEGLDPYREALADLPSIPRRRDNASPASLLFKPLGQVALFRGLLIAARNGMEPAAVVRRANRVDWRITSDLWRETIVRSGARMVARKEAMDLAAHLIAYLVGAEAMEPADVERLRASYLRARSEDESEALPEPVAA